MSRFVRMRRFTRRPRAVQIASWLLISFLSLLAVVSATTQYDPGFTVGMRAMGILITILASWCFIVLQEQLLAGWRTRTTSVLATLVVMLGLINVAVSHTWTLLGVSTATAMMVAPRRWSLPMGTLVWAIGSTEVFLDSAQLTTRVAIVLTTLLTAVVLVTFTRSAQALSVAEIVKEQHARLQVDDERHRISRDLHDIMGRTLVAASLRNEVAIQLLDRDPLRARDQLLQVREVISQGQAQLRHLTSGSVVADLTGELTAANSLCARLGIVCEMDATSVRADGRTNMLSAMLIREAVTNMLRHSNPRLCEIEVHQDKGLLMVSVTNDGCGARENDGTGENGIAGTGDFAIHAVRARSAGAGSGTGLAELRHRVEDLGGTFEAGPVTGHRFRVLARLPSTNAATEDGS